METRDIEQQFEPEKASRLRTLAEGYLSLRKRHRVSGYYLTELSHCINTGLLLSAMELAYTVLEIWVRDLLVIRRATAKSYEHKIELEYNLAKLDNEIEGVTRGDNFNKICKELHKLEVVNEKELEWLLSTYKEMRNPLKHGISARIVSKRWNKDKTEKKKPSSKEEMFLATIFEYDSPEDRFNRFEQYIEEEVEPYLQQILNFIADHDIPPI